MKRSALLFILGFLSSVMATHGQTCCSGGVPLSNNLGLPNEGKNTWILGLAYDYNNLNTLNAGTQTLDDDSRLRITNSILLNFGYSITERLSVETLWSWVRQSRTISQFGNENLTDTDGIGDAVFLVKYTFPDVFKRGFLVSIGGGVKAPLGQSDILTDQGIQLTADLQPGSGAWDIVGLLSISKQLGFRPTASISGSLTTRLTGTNFDYLGGASSYEFGDELQAFIGYTDQILLGSVLINPGLVFKYRKAWIDRINTFELPNTGGEWFFLRPELGVALAPNVNLQSRLEIPLYSYVDGTQLTPTLRFTIGASVVLGKKNSIDNTIQTN